MKSKHSKYPEIRTEKTLLEHQAWMLVPDDYQLSRLSAEEKKQYGWLHSAKFSVVWLQSDVVRGNRYVSWFDMTSVYRKPYLKDWRDAKRLREKIEAMQNMYCIKTESNVYFVDTIENGRIAELCVQWYEKGKFRKIDFMDLD